MKYWINTISRDHVLRGIQGGFTQANHGKPTVLKRLKKDDWIVFYSSKVSYPDGKPLQAFTAIGQVADDDLYQVEMEGGWMPWRRNVTFYPCRETPIKPLIDDLGFITNKTNWGFKFRFGLFEIPQADFKKIQACLQKSP